MSILPKKQPSSKNNRSTLLHVNGDFAKKLRWMINDGLSAVFMHITPSLALAMMEHNKSDEWHNRPESKSALERFKAAMRRNWKLTGEPLIFSVSGRLLNGQHRLVACIETGLSFPCLVVFGIDDDAFKYIDIGTRRTAAHIFMIEDIPNYAVVAAASRVVLAYDQRQIGSGEHSGVKLVIENQELLDWYRSNERIQESVHFGALTREASHHSKTVGTALHYIFARKHRANADEFCERVGAGIGLEKSSPEYRLRKALDDSAKDEKKRLHWSTKMAYTVISWNNCRQGTSPRTLTWRTEARPDAPFPIAI